MRLASLQKWMQAVVVHPGTTAQALRSREAARHLKPSAIETVLLPSPTLKAAERIAIYQEMYPLRMRDALSSDYPAVEHFLGDRFWDFVVAYTQAHPSMAYTLNRLGNDVPAFIGKQKRMKHRGFLRDLARLELAVTQAFDSPRSETLRAEDLEAIPPSRIGGCVLVTSPSLRILALDWNAYDYLDTIRDDQHNHPRPRRVRATVAVVRKDLSVYRFAVSPAELAALSDLKDGLTIEEIARRALGRRTPRRASETDLPNWFRSWTADGFFSGVRIPKRSGKLKLTN